LGKDIRRKCRRRRGARCRRG
jgi:hypothetical protein